MIKLNFDANPKHSEISAISARDSYWCNSFGCKLPMNKSIFGQLFNGLDKLADSTVH